MALGRATTSSPDYPSGPADGTGTVTSAGREWAFRHVNVGNPQCVVEVGDEVETIDLEAIGPEIENATALFPNRTNVSFVRFDGSTVRARIFERGVGVSLSSGTGRERRGRRRVPRRRAEPDHGRASTAASSTVELSDELDITLIGTASRVYRGELDPEFVAALGAEEAPSG